MCGPGRGGEGDGDGDDAEEREEGRGEAVQHQYQNPGVLMYPLVFFVGVVIAQVVILLYLSCHYWRKIHRIKQFFVKSEVFFCMLHLL